MTVFMFGPDNNSWGEGAGMGRLAGYYWKQEWGLECVCRAIRASFTIFSMPGNMSFTGSELGLEHLLIFASRVSSNGGEELEVYIYIYLYMYSSTQRD